VLIAGLAIGVGDGANNLLATQTETPGRDSYTGGYDYTVDFLLREVRRSRDGEVADARLVPLATPEAVPTVRLEPESVVRADISTETPLPSMCVPAAQGAFHTLANCSY